MRQLHSAAFSHWPQAQIPHLPGQTEGRIAVVVQRAVLPRVTPLRRRHGTFTECGRSKFQRWFSSRISGWLQFPYLICTMYRTVERQLSEGTVGMSTRTRGAVDQHRWMATVPYRESGSCSRAGIGVPGCLLSSLLRSHQEDQSGVGTMADLMAAHGMPETDI